MPKLASIGPHGQKQALWAHVWAKNGPKTAEARPDWHYTATGLGVEQDPRTYVVMVRRDSIARRVLKTLAIGRGPARTPGGRGTDTACHTGPRDE
jgi:hypothetical protein